MSLWGCGRSPMVWYIRALLLSSSETSDGVQSKHFCQQRRNTLVFLLKHTQTRARTHTGCLHESTVQSEGEKRFLQVSQEVLHEASDDVDVIHFAEYGNCFAAKKLLLQLLHTAICTRQAVQTRLRRRKWR